MLHVPRPQNRDGAFRFFRRPSVRPSRGQAAAAAAVVLCINDEAVAAAAAAADRGPRLASLAGVTRERRHIDVNWPLCRRSMGGGTWHNGGRRRRRREHAACYLL